MLTLALVLTLVAQTPPEEGLAPIQEVGRKECRVAALGNAKPLVVQIVESVETLSGATREWEEKHREIEVPGAAPLRFDYPNFSVSCEQGAILVTWTGAFNEKASLRVVAEKGGLVVEPGLRQRLERAWTEGSAPELAALKSLVDSLPSELRPAPELVDAAGVVAAKSALREQNFMLAEVLLDEPPKKTSEWSKRRQELRAELKETRAKTQPVRAGKPVRIGTKLLSMTVPPMPTADLFWRGESVCIAQEDATPPTHMRCFHSRTRKWGQREPFRIPPSGPGEVRVIGGGNPCDYVDICWHSALPPGDSACSGLPCNELLAVIPGPLLVSQGGKGLVGWKSLKKPEPLPGGVPAEVLARLPGSVLAGGQLYFLGADLVDATRRGRSWKPFEGVLEGAWMTLVSPDLKWVLVSTSPKESSGKSTLWLVPLKR